MLDGSMCHSLSMLKRETWCVTEDSEAFLYSNWKMRLWSQITFPKTRKWGDHSRCGAPLLLSPPEEDVDSQTLSLRVRAAAGARVHMLRIASCDWLLSTLLNKVTPSQVKSVTTRVWAAPVQGPLAERFVCMFTRTVVWPPSVALITESHQLLFMGMV